MMMNTQEKVKQDLLVLEEFFAAEDTKDLEKNIAYFSPLNIFCPEKSEAFHQNMISWLLDPKESHNLGPKFLELFLKRIHLKEENISIYDKIIKLTGKSGKKLPDNISVNTEYRGIDIVIFFGDKYEPIYVLAIELKITPHEHKGQTEGYEKKIAEFGEHDGFLLTSGIELPVEGPWPSICYKEIKDPLDEIVKTVKNDKNNILQLLRRYSDILYDLIFRKNGDQNTNDDRLCKKLMKVCQNEEALKTIRDYRILATAKSDKTIKKERKKGIDLVPIKRILDSHRMTAEKIYHFSGRKICPSKPDSYIYGDDFKPCPKQGDAAHSFKAKDNERDFYFVELKVGLRIGERVDGLKKKIVSFKNGKFKCEHPYEKTSVFFDGFKRTNLPDDLPDIAKKMLEWMKKAYLPAEMKKGDHKDDQSDNI